MDSTSTQILAWTLPPPIFALTWTSIPLLNPMGLTEVVSVYVSPSITHGPDS